MLDDEKIVPNEFCSDPELILDINRRADAEVRPFMEQTGLYYFCHLRCYRDGSFQPITTPFPILRDYLKGRMGVISSHNELTQYEKNYIFSWSDGMPKSYDKTFFQRYNIFEGLTFVNRYSGYFDMIGFTFPDFNFDIITYYVNNIWRFESFAKKFRNSAEKYFREMGEVRVTPPQNLIDPNLGNMFEDMGPKKYRLRTAEIDIFLTPQERNCLMLFKARYSLKDMAREMEISPKSVETYLNRIKQKAGVEGREELKDLAMYCE